MIPHDVEQRFLQALMTRGLRLKDVRDDSGRYVVDIRGTESAVTLENIAREVARTGDLAIVDRFVESLLHHPEVPPWDEARAGLRLLAKSSRFGVARGCVFCDVSEGIHLYLVHDVEEAPSLAFVSGEKLEEWGVGADEAFAVGRENMDQLLERTELVLDTYQGRRFGWFEADPVFSGSLFAAPGLKSKAEPLVGWPALVLAPRRDLLWVLPSEGCADLLDLLGPRCVQEFEDSGYPVSTELLFFDDPGYRVVGRFTREGFEETE